MVYLCADNEIYTSFISGFSTPEEAFESAKQKKNFLMAIKPFRSSDRGSVIIDMTGKDEEFLVFPKPLQVMEVWEDKE